MMPISEAFVAACQAMATVIIEKPFPIGLNTATVGDWEMKLNTSTSPIDLPGMNEAIGPLELRATNNRYLIVAVLDPTGGMIGGMPEAKFIEEMTALGAA